MIGFILFFLLNSYACEPVSVHALFHFDEAEWSEILREYPLELYPNQVYSKAVIQCFDGSTRTQYFMFKDEDLNFVDFRILSHQVIIFIRRRDTGSIIHEQPIYPLPSVDRS